MPDPRTFRPVDRWLYVFLAVLLVAEIIWLNLPFAEQARSWIWFAGIVPATVLGVLIVTQLAFRGMRFSGLANMIALGVLIGCLLLALFLATTFPVG